MYKVWCISQINNHYLPFLHYIYLDLGRFAARSTSVSLCVDPRDALMLLLAADIKFSSDPEKLWFNSVALLRLLVEPSSGVPFSTVVCRRESNKVFGSLALPWLEDKLPDELDLCKEFLSPRALVEKFDTSVSSWPKDSDGLTAEESDVPRPLLVFEDGGVTGCFSLSFSLSITLSAGVDWNAIVKDLALSFGSTLFVFYKNKIWIITFFVYHFKLPTF